ncbi:unannotated protein [freshwater metagenome]|nr:ATP-binding cassette domain-containing protein [Actinomycetota bacterium]
MSSFPTLSVGENLLVGRLPMGKRGLVNWTQLWEMAEASLKLVGLDVNPRVPMASLGVASRQMVAIAQALSRSAKLIILDEPTAALAKPEISRLFKLMKNLSESGVAIIYISHHLQEVFSITDRVTVLRDGLSRGTFQTSEISSDDLIREMGASSALTKRARKSQTHHSSMDFHKDNVLLEVKDLSKENAFSKISLTIHSGEIVGLTGLEGCGKHELVQALFGLQKASGGTANFGGSSKVAQRPREAISRGMGYLSQDRRGESVFEQFNVADNLTMTVLDRLQNKWGFQFPSKAEKVAKNAISTYSIICTGPEQNVGTLSGGNQQKVALGKMLESGPSLLLLEEPTQGVDIAAKASITTIVAEACERGAGVLLVSDEIETLLQVTDRVIVLYKGSQIAEFNTEDLDGETLIRAIEGIDE